MTKKADSVKFESNGNTHVLRMTPSAWIELEDAGFGNINELAATLKEQPSFKTFVKVFAAGLRGGSPDNPIDDDGAMRIANAIGSEQTIVIVGEAVTASFPMTKGKAGNVNTTETTPKAKAGTGTRS